MSADKTALSYWFPKIEAAGIPVPKTVLVDMPEAAQESIWALFDGKDAGDPKPFFAELAKATSVVGYPCFLRTDHTSGKHNWEKTCFLPDEQSIPEHVAAICEFSEICDFIGLPWTRWAVREFLPTQPYGICPLYGNMPVCREFRFFVKDGVMQCWHPYWPEGALNDGGAVGIDIKKLNDLHKDELAHLKALAEDTGFSLPGAWSIDILETKRGWFVTDMAEAHKSFHWPGCSKALATTEGEEA